MAIALLHLPLDDAKLFYVQQNPSKYAGKRGYKHVLHINPYFFTACVASHWGGREVPRTVQCVKVFELP